MAGAVWAAQAVWGEMEAEVGSAAKGASGAE